MEKYNKEGYLDLTPYLALKDFNPRFSYHPMVFICSPYAGDTKHNIKEAQKYSKFAAEQGYIPITPHLLFPQFLNDNIKFERDLGIFFGMALMSKCEEVWVFGKNITNGMKMELSNAKNKNKYIRYFDVNCYEI